MKRHFSQDAIFYVLLMLPIPLWLGLFIHDPNIEKIDEDSLILMILVLPVLEEIFFRGLLQPWLATNYPTKTSNITQANIMTSSVFALVHLFAQPLLLALCTFIPSMIFGFAKERYSRLLPSIILHSSYNGGYLLLGTKLLNNEIMSPILF